LNRFDYNEAFARTLGWVTEAEQSQLRQRRVAIAGLGGVGGVHLLTLTRLGIGKFNIADNDRFELVNFNRQAGATVDSIGRPNVSPTRRNTLIESMSGSTIQYSHPPPVRKAAA